MAYDLATVTNSGNQLLASVVPDRSSLVIDKIEVSGTQLASSTDLKSMTSISNVVKTLSANGYQKKDNSFIISTVLDNSSVKVDYQAWVFGIWAHKADGGSSVLMSVITSTNSPDTISKGSGTPIDYNYKFVTTFSNTSSLTIQMASDSYATNDTVLHNSGDETATGTKTFQEIKISNNKFPSLVQTDGQYITLDGGNTEILPADNSKVVHTTGDETIDGKKKFDTDPTDSAGNAYAKTVDVNQQLDKKVNVADMRKPASDVAGIEEVNAKQDTIGYTPADDSKVVHNSSNDAILYGNNIFNLRTQLSSKDDIFKITQEGLFQAINTAPANNPWGAGKTISGDCLSLWWSFIFVDDNGEVYVETPNTQKWDRKVSENGTNNFHGKNTFDTAPIDKTTGNPYITKDGVPAVPSTLADTTKPANFTAGLQSGGISVATSDDLKSVEADAWHVAESDYPGLLMQVDRDDKIIYILSTGDPTTTRIADGQDSPIICDLSSYIDRIVSASGYITTRDVYINVSQRYTLGFTGAKLLAHTKGQDYILGEGGYSVSGDPKVLNNTSAFLKLQYNSWIGE